MSYLNHYAKETMEDDAPPSTIPMYDTPLTMACWRDGKWHADELANLAAKLERELKQYQSCAPCRHEWYLGQCAHCGITAEEFRK